MWVTLVSHDAQSTLWWPSLIYKYIHHLHNIVGVIVIKYRLKMFFYEDFLKIITYYVYENSRAITNCLIYFKVINFCRSFIINLHKDTWRIVAIIIYIILIWNLNFLRKLFRSQLIYHSINSICFVFKIMFNRHDAVQSSS